ncbi:sulfatase [Aquimarina sp. ERC-38]|uniref:sulfatase n=1 Tax=Aquimarina sp. ERC-38 TaxID=2949996 RepID=UPI0022484C4D|nr:sulfatase [Aquimarina sp. ERC-38]UZO82222.1 sulfatase [Aquimarina sp. ERC-38]
MILINLIKTILLFYAMSFYAQGKPNIVFLLVDDLGWGDLCCYGATFNETPNIDALAKQGMLFTNAYACSTVCSPSRAAILTGRYPARTHITDWISGHNFPYAKLSIPDWNMKIEHTTTTLAEALKQGGYHTSFFGKWHLIPENPGDLASHYPTNHGFDINIGGNHWGMPKGKGKYFSPFEMPNLDDGNPGDFLTDKLTGAAITYLDTIHRGKPFFLYLSYYTVHGPLMCPEKLEKKYTEKAQSFKNTKKEFIDPKRAGMLTSLDNSVGRIVKKIEALGISDNTILILTGDNGGNFDQTTAGLRGYKGFSYEGGVREPFIVRWPGKIAPNTTSDEVIIGTDVYPTVLELAGLPLKPGEHQDGISIAPLLKGDSKNINRDAVYWHYPHYHRTKPYGAVRKGDYKLIEFFEDGSLELYNLRKDPRETQNLASTHQVLSLELLQNLKNWRHSVGAQMMKENPKYDPLKAELKVKN